MNLDSFHGEGDRRLLRPAFVFLDFIVQSRAWKDLRTNRDSRREAKTSVIASAALKERNLRMRTWILASYINLVIEVFYGMHGNHPR